MKATEQINYALTIETLQIALSSKANVPEHILKAMQTKIVDSDWSDNKIELALDLIAELSQA